MQNTDSSQLQGMAARVAAQQDISRTDLAMWDASARAWLMSADEVQKVNLTQLRLIIKDCGLFVSTLGATYDSVIDVWTVAMKTLQDLILGMPQRISKGALLVGLSSWHIYPDHNVVGPTAHINFSDELVAKGGIITLGLESTSTQQDLGVQWSLSLSHLRYYGKTITVSAISNANGSRISMEELHLVVLGSVLGSWSRIITAPETGAKLITAIVSSLSFQDDDELAEVYPGLHLLWRAARRFLEITSDIDRRNALCLVSFGRRRARNFFVRASRSVPIPLAYGLADPYVIVKFDLDHQSAKSMAAIHEITKLRAFAESCDYSSEECIIQRCRNMEPGQKIIPERDCEYITATPFNHKSTLKRGSDGEPKGTPTHVRWLSRPSNPMAQAAQGTEIAPCCEYYDTGDIYTQESESSHHSLAWRNPPEHFKEAFKSYYNDYPTCPQSDPYVIFFQHDVGDPEGICLYRMNPQQPAKLLQDRQIIEHLSKSPSISKGLRRWLNKAVRTYTPEYIRPDSDWCPTSTLNESLIRLAYAASLYHHLPGATISLSVVKCPIWEVHWFTRLLKELSAKFACITFFETGTIDVQPEQLKPVMGLSSGNSIYVANSLLQDPIWPNSYGPRGITRIVGNLDHPGVVMLAPPQAPLVRDIEPSCWRIINHSLFTGKAENCFPETTLHLSFTKYEVPLSVPIGAVDAEISMLETLVAAYDGKQWIADLDIIASLKCEDYFKRFRPPHCSHEDPKTRPVLDNAAVQIAKITGKQLVSIDSWEELLDPPEGLGTTNIGVLRACDNWDARVAATAVCVQQRLRTVVLPTESLCTICGVDALRNMADFAQILIL